MARRLQRTDFLSFFCQALLLPNQKQNLFAYSWKKSCYSEYYFKSALEMASQVDLYANVYREVSAIPTITSGCFVDQDENILNICSNWSVNDLVTMEKTSFSRNYIYNKGNCQIMLAGRPYDTSSMFRQAFSKSGKKQAIFRERKTTQKNSNDNWDLEIWNEYKKEKTIDLSDIDEHGKVNNNAFGCLSWSSDERYLIYTAEAKRPKATSFFKSSKGDGEDSKKKGAEYIYREEWGEDFVGSHHSVLLILDVETLKTEIVSIDKQYEEISIGESIWGPDDKTIVFVGYKEFPRRLGIRSCPIRSCSIYAYDRQTKEIECISGEKDTAVRCPRFSPDFKTLIYLENDVGGPHDKGSILQKMDWETKKISMVVATVDRPNLLEDEFPGLYEIAFPKECWFKNSHVFLSSQWRSYVRIVCINIDNGKVQKIEPLLIPQPTKDDHFGECTVLSVYKKYILVKVSSIIFEPCLALGCIQEDSIDEIKWQFLDSNTPVKHANIRWKVCPVAKDYEDRYYEFVFTEPIDINKSLEPRHVILNPHGGPHCAHSGGFSKEVLAFAKLGYLNILVNYRGSTGFGEKFLNSLPGKVGTNDVHDCQLAASIIHDLPFSVTDTFIVGGSHGGFLGASLIGLHPNKYSAAILRNPVIDIAGMTETTDIPDWNYVEGGCGDVMDSSKVITPDQLNSMWEKSPLKNAEKIKTPVLLLLGSKDLRVPYSQGLKFYHLLKARKVPVSVYVYEDNHSLGKTPHNADVFMQTMLFIEKHTTNIRKE